MTTSPEDWGFIGYRAPRGLSKRIANKALRETSAMPTSITLFHDAKNVVFLKYDRTTTAILRELNVAIKQHTDGCIVRNFDFGRNDISFTLNRGRFIGAYLNPNRFVRWHLASKSIFWLEFKLNRMRLASRCCSGRTVVITLSMRLSPCCVLSTIAPV